MSKGRNGGGPQRPGARGARAPAKRDPAGTRDRILRAAIREFARHGFGGARVQAICRAASANPRMIYHYFGDKAGLYVAALEHVFEALRAHELKLDVDHLAPLDAMLRLFHFVHGHFASHPEIITLLSAENLVRARYLRRSKTVSAISSPVLGLIDRLLRKGVSAGVFRPGIDPFQLYVAMVALSFFHRSNAYTLSFMFDTDMRTPAWRARQKRQAEDMLLRFVRSDGRA